MRGSPLTSGPSEAGDFTVSGRGAPGISQEPGPQEGGRGNISRKSDGARRHAAWDGAPPAPTIGSAPFRRLAPRARAGLLSDHKVPLQLLITREGKALLLHKIEGEGYCNGQEVRQ